MVAARVDKAVARANILAECALVRSWKVREALVKEADGIDSGPEDFHLLLLRDSKCEHSASMGVRDPEVRAEKLESGLLRLRENGRVDAHRCQAGQHPAITPRLVAGCW